MFYRETAEHESTMSSLSLDAMPEGASRRVEQVVYTRDSRSGWSVRLAGADRALVRGDKIKTLRNRLRRILVNSHGEELELDELIELPLELSTAVDEYAELHRDYLVLRERVFRERILLAKRLLQIGIPLMTAAELLRVTAQRLGIVLREEATGKRPRLKVCAPLA
jgi:hypothetical protein